MPLLSLESYVSTPDENGNIHWVSTDITSRKPKGGMVQYVGKLRSKSGIWDDRHDSLVTVTFLRRCTRSLSKSWAESEVKKANLVQGYASLYNNMMTKLCRSSLTLPVQNDDVSSWMPKVRVQVPQTSALESSSVLARRRSEGECFIFEDKIKSSKMQTFFKTSYEDSNYCCSNDAMIIEKIPTNMMSNFLRNNENINNSSTGFYQTNVTDVFNRKETDSPPYYTDVFNLKETDPPPYYNDPSSETRTKLYPSLENFYNTPNEIGEIPHEIVHAFCHHFFVHFGGKMAVDNLQGTYDPEAGRYTLTRPFVHSLDGGLGFADGGRDGVLRVAQQHICCKLCSYLPNMVDVFRNNAGPSEGRPGVPSELG